MGAPPGLAQRDPTTARALHHSGRLEIKFEVQTRQIRGSHDDVLFCQFQLRLLKHFAVRFKDNASMLCLDDKAVIPVGEPARPISATARQHNRCPAPLHGAAVAALDHDFHVCGVIPSVAFKCDITCHLTRSSQEMCMLS